jgi:hypothetical protein
MILEWIICGILVIGWNGFLVWKMYKDKDKDLNK